MRKKVTGLLALAMSAALLMTACGGSDSSSTSSASSAAPAKQESAAKAESETKEESTTAAASTKEETAEAPAASGEVYTIKFSNVGAAGGFMDTAASRVGDRLNEVAKEKLGYEAFNMECYSGGMLASSDQEDMELVMQGTVQYSYAPNAIMYQYMSEYPILNVIDLPHIFSSSDAFYDFCNESDIMKEIYAGLETSHGIKFGGCYTIGDLYIASTSHELHKLDDLKGQRIRIMTSDTYVAVSEALGFAGTPMAFGEVYTGLQQGTIDGVMASTLSFTDQKFYQEAPYIVTNGSGLLNPEFTFWNVKWLESLPDDVRAVVEQVINEDEKRIWRETSEEYLADADQIMIDAGCDLYELPADEAAIWKEKCMSTYAGLADVCGGQENIDKVMKWLSDNGY